MFLNKTDSSDPNFFENHVAKIRSVILVQALI